MFELEDKKLTRGERIQCWLVLMAGGAVESVIAYRLSIAVYDKFTTGHDLSPTELNLLTIGVLVVGGMCLFIKKVVGIKFVGFK